MAAAASPLETFIWGAGGAKKTPEQVAREREIAAAIMGRAGDTSPVGHWTQGAAKVVDTLGGVFRENRANAAEEEGMARGKSAFDPIVQALMGGGGASSGQASFAGAAAPASVPQTADAQAIRQGMISRGLPEHVADGFLMNMQDESGLNPGINEAQPLVPGSRGGYGLYQLTGPRRVAYEQYAQQLGVDPSNVDAQLDFLMSELQGPEAAAALSILSAPDAGSAAAAIATNFLRPSKQHLDRRVASYTAGGGNLSAQPAPVQVASLDPSIGMPAQLPEIGPSGGPQLSPAAPASPAPAQEIAQALMVPPQGGAAPQQANSLLPLLMQASGDPWARKQYGGIIDALMGSEMQQRQQASDPLRQLQIERAQMENAAMRNPGRKPPIEVGGVLVDSDTFQPVFDSRQPSDNGFTLSPGQQRFDAQGNPIAAAQPDPGFRLMTPDELQGVPGLDPNKAYQVGPDNKIYEIGGGGVNVNLGDQGQRMGTVPAGMAAVPDPSNPSGFRLEPIPGGPAAMAAEAAAAAAAAGQEASGRTANIVREDIGRIKSIVESAPWYNPAVGFGADLAASIAGSNATNVSALSKTVLANIGFDRLQQMREASPTGGALGAISDRELGTLQAVMGNLEQSQSVEQFIYNLDRLGQVYDEISQKAAAYPNAKGFGFVGEPGQSQANPDVVDFTDYFK